MKAHCGEYPDAGSERKGPWSREEQQLPLPRDQRELSSVFLSPRSCCPVLGRPPLHPAFSCSLLTGRPASRPCSCPL